MVVLDDDVEVVLGPRDGLPVDLALIDALARLRLETRRRGCTLRLRDPSPRLCELLDLVGLAELAAGAEPLAREPEREAERGEQLGVQEVVDPGDAPA